MNVVGLVAAVVVGGCLLVAREMKYRADGAARAIVAPAFVAGAIAGAAVAAAWLV